MDTPDIEARKKDIKRRMEGAVDVLHTEFGGLRTGRAATSLLEPLMVDAYGTGMPITQVGTIGVPEPRMLTVQVWDKNLVKSVERPSGNRAWASIPPSTGSWFASPSPR